MAYIAGAFTVTYGGSTLGEAQEGFTLEHFVNKQLITGDNEARTPQDAVYQGSEVFVEMVLNEWNASGVASAMWPYNGTRGDNGTVGVLDSATWGALVLTSVSGTSANGLSSEQQFTANQAILAENFPVRVLLSPTLRTVPLRFRLYPSSDVFYTWSATA